MKRPRPITRAAQAPEQYRAHAAVGLTQDWRIFRTGSDHIEWRSPDGKTTVWTASTPGSYMGAERDKAKLNRAGLRPAGQPHRRRQPVASLTGPAPQPAPPASGDPAPDRPYGEDLAAIARNVHAGILTAATAQGGGERVLRVPGRAIAGHLWTGNLAETVRKLLHNGPLFGAGSRELQDLHGRLCSRTGNLVMVRRGGRVTMSLWWVRAEFTEDLLPGQTYGRLRAAAAALASSPAADVTAREAVERRAAPAPAEDAAHSGTLQCTWRYIDDCLFRAETRWELMQHTAARHDGIIMPLTSCPPPEVWEAAGLGAPSCGRTGLTPAARGMHLVSHGIRGGTEEKSRLDARHAAAIWAARNAGTPAAAPPDAPERAPGPPPPAPVPPEPAPVVLAEMAVPATVGVNGHGAPVDLDRALDAFAAIADAAQSVAGKDAEIARLTARVADLEAMQARLLEVLQVAR